MKVIAELYSDVQGTNLITAVDLDVDSKAEGVQEIGRILSENNFFFTNGLSIWTSKVNPYRIKRNNSSFKPRRKVK